MKPSIDQLAVIEKRETGYFYKILEIIGGREEEKSQVLDRIEKDIAGAGTEYPGTDTADIASAFVWCVNEAIDNALEHAHRNNPKALIGIQYFRTDKELVACVRDQGEGLDLEPTEVAEPVSRDDIRVMARQRVQRGYGLRGIRGFMDRVSYSHNTLYMRKYLLQKAPYPDK